MRSDVRFRTIDSPGATSPVILYHRAGDTSRYLELVKRLIRDMYAERPAWLEVNNLGLPGTGQGGNGQGGNGPGGDA